MELTRVIKHQVGEIKYVRILRDGNIMIGCNSTNQVEKARKLQCVGKIKISNTARIREQRTMGI